MIDSLPQHSIWEIRCNSIAKTPQGQQKSHVDQVMIG
jgi:hypothetical protein